MRPIRPRPPSVTLAALLLSALPVLSCTSSSPAAGGQSAELRSTTTETCVPDPNKNSPRICIDDSGMADPERLTMNSHTNSVGNPILWQQKNGKPLTITLSADCAEVIALPQCNASQCHSRSIPRDTPGSCTYTASVTGGGTADPVIDTDSCCPPPGTENPGHKP